ncbi:DNA mismatch repair protein MutS2 [Breznakibacter xylanolyticus]|uniref:Endonuclease MutS2 n=1 Tax=Breznakibacter xylanolyticus TaxID=990 RepID=A0A2W7NR96_9BACT|nr:Smr/MutS family protein [Breznakibacter xylanolyticus]PZX13812.1 DNA mismatch repair protein MutS2 [Breznakibacter xylanolyticus]
MPTIPTKIKDRKLPRLYRLLKFFTFAPNKAKVVIYPQNFEEKIKFTRIREHLKAHCASTLGIERVDAMQFTSRHDEMTGWLLQTHEMLVLMTTADGFPTMVFVDIREALKKIRIEGLYLEEKDLFDLRRSLASIRDLVRFLSSQDEVCYPSLRALAAQVTIYPGIIDRIDQILNKFGKIKDNATPELAAIRRDIQEKMAGINRRMMAILKQAKQDGLVEADASISIREGRAVIPVPSPNKRKLGGIIHDESATGKTTFIEPAEIVETNNQLRELEYAERREIIRILTAISNDIRPYLDDLFYSYEFLGWIDFIMAKAKFAQQTGSTLPALGTTPDMTWDRAVHPLLLLQFQQTEHTVVPLDIELKADERILLISGPNAGGKSVCLQTVGLLQYMLQCGMLVPMRETSRMGFVEHIFIDMGDEQSIENDLSTYSSHLTNMKHFLRHSNGRTLVLIDEFGTGTEPMLGGAIAESVLAQLNRQGVYGVITTHYTNLKHYAAQTPGIINGAMMFDTHAIQPLFKLEMGQPGSSFAFEIARKIGLPESILTESKEKIGQDHIDFDKHLREIVRDKRYWEQKRESIRINEKRLEEVLARYQGELAKVKQERKTILDQAKTQAANLLNTANKQIENTIREIRETQADKERTRLLRQQLDEVKEKVEQSAHDRDDTVERKIRQIQEREKRKQEKATKPQHPPREAKAAPEREPVTNAPLQKGDSVKLPGQEIPGEILEIQGNTATVAFGNLKTSVKINKLTRISKSNYKKEVRQAQESFSSELSERIRNKKLNFKADIDVRGMRADEALQAVMSHIDDAIICETSSLKILHGKGDGILRKMIRDYLASVKEVRSCRDEHVQFGGSGITIVEFV